MTKQKRTPGARLTSCGYASLAREVQKLGSAATSRNVADAVNAGHVTVRQTLRRLSGLGVLRVSGWVKNCAGHGPFVAVYCLADGKPDADYPEHLRESVRPMTSTRHIRPELVAFASAFSAMREGARQLEMVESGAGCRQTVKKLLTHCRAIGLVYVCKWVKQDSGGAHLPVYKIGPGEDVARPAKLSGPEIWRAQYLRRCARRNADPFAVPEDFESPVRQKLYKATSRSIPSTTAANSVFALGKVA